jgi:two-component system nitrogen regulation response regulator GlnG
MGRSRPKKRIEEGPIPALTMVWHPAARRTGERLLLQAVADGGEVGVSRNAPDFLRAGSIIGEPISDPFVSRRPIRFVAAADGGITVIVPSGATRVVCGERPPGGAELGRDEIANGVPIALAERVVLLLHLTEPGGVPPAQMLGMVGTSAVIQRVRAHVERVADVHVPVLIRGETGTGKELVAQAIHAMSPRKAGPFVTVNLGAIPKELAAAELFGAQKGSFTGATRDREGFFKAAHGGTLFLDELGEAPADVQAMLLRVLETGEMYPVGASSPIAVDVRLIAATDANLEGQIRDGRFKAPLLHRVSGYEVWIPPLRERREDIGALIYHFAAEELATIGEGHRLDSADMYADPWLPASLATRLVRHDWPGNIRQLRNVVRRIVIGSRGQAAVQLDPQLDLELAAGAAPQATPRYSVVPVSIVRPTAPPPSRRKPADVSEAELLAALRANAWDLKAAADRLGIPRPSMYDLIDRSRSIRTAGDLAAEEI